LALLPFRSTVTPISYPLRSLSSKFGSASPCRTLYRGLPVHVPHRPTTGELRRRRCPCRRRRCLRRLPPVSPTPMSTTKWARHHTLSVIFLSVQHLAVGSAQPVGPPAWSARHPRAGEEAGVAGEPKPLQAGRHGL
jgi:hypothetical protein